MLILDVNPLVYALRGDLPEHRAWHRWLEATLAGGQPVGACNATLASTLRIATSAHVFAEPTPSRDVLEFIDGLRDAPAWLQIEPGPAHWKLVDRLVRDGRLKGNLISDAYLAALALEADAELITADADFARFAGLRFRDPTRRAR